MSPDPYRRRLEMVLENAHHGIVVVSSRGIIEIANPALGRLTGHDHRALAGQRIDWIIPEPHREKHDSYMREHQNGAHSEILTRGRIISVQHLDGRTIPVFIRVHETRLDGEHFFTAILEDVSEQALLREQLSEGQKLLQSVVESNPCGIFITDKHVTRNVYVNQALCQIYGASQGELLLPGAWQHFIYAPDRSALFAVMQQAIETQSAAEVVHRVQARSGILRWVHVGAKPLVRDGAFHGFVGSVLDITRYKEAELEIEAERARMYEITRMLPASIKYFDSRGRYVFVNRSVERTWGRTLEEFRGHHYREILPVSMLEKIEPYMSRALAGEEVRFSISVSAAQGARHFETTYIPHRVDGRVAGVTASAVDVTESRELNESLRTYEQIVESMTEGIIVSYEAEPRIDYANPALCEMLGRSPGALIDSPVPEPLLSPGQTQLLRADGRVVDVLVRQKSIELSGRTARLTIVTDISSLKQAEREITAESEKASRATQAKSRFIKHLSHEIRNPLNAMLGYSDLLLHQDRTIPEDVREMLSHIRSAGLGLSRLLGEVLDLEQIEAGRMTLRGENFALVDVLEEINSGMQYRALRDKLDFTIRIAPDVPQHLCLDRMRLYQILSNLTVNAAKYSPSGSRIELSVNIDAGRLHFHVADNGPGIPPEFEEMLFQPFSRAEAAQHLPGTGLGLYLSRQMAELMGGSLVHEKTLAGTTFCLRLPLTAGRVETTGADEPSVLFPGLKAIVVDDSELNRMVLRAILERLGAIVTVAANADEALMAASVSRPQIAFVDFHMPGRNGIETVAALKRVLSGMKSVLLSGDVFEKDTLTASGADGFLLKPFDTGAVQSILRRLF